MTDYEERKKRELSEITNAWEYVRCSDRYRGSHIIKCVACGREKMVRSIYNVPECSICHRMLEKQHKEQSKYKVCKQCGEVFKAKRSTGVYCSTVCSAIARKARRADRYKDRWKANKRLREARATKNGKVDYSITLARLIERDKHTCQLCGRLVNDMDYVYVGDTFIAGNDYPSIDHIKPLSKGGTHQWNNVQLAHRLCNSKKWSKEI